jgi:hypothetical protein
VVRYKPGFAPRSHRMGFVKNKMALGQVFVPSPSVPSCHYSSATAPYSVIYRLGVGHRVCYQPQFHRNTVLHHCNNNNRDRNILCPSSARHSVPTQPIKVSCLVLFQSVIMDMCSLH